MSRRQRRAQQNGRNNIQTADDIPHTQPFPSKPKPAKTLLEIAAEKQAQLNPTARKFNPRGTSSNVVNVTIDESGNVIPLGIDLPGTSNMKWEEGGEEEEEKEEEGEISPYLDTLFLAITLSTLHFTLELLTMHQYAQEIRYSPIFQHTLFIAFPTLLLLIHFFHGHFHLLGAGALPEKAKNALYGLRQATLLAMANIAGCYLIKLTNEEGYYAVMKNAPGIGTLWVFAILELGLVGAVAGVVGPGLYAWKMGYGVM